MIFSASPMVIKVELSAATCAADASSRRELEAWCYAPGVLLPLPTAPEALADYLTERTDFGICKSRLVCPSVRPCFVYPAPVRHLRRVRLEPGDHLSGLQPSPLELTRAPPARPRSSPQSEMLLAMTQLMVCQAVLFPGALAGCCPPWGSSPLAVEGRPPRPQAPLVPARCCLSFSNRSWHTPARKQLDRLRPRVIMTAPPMERRHDNMLHVVAWLRLKGVARR